MQTLTIREVENMQEYYSPKEVAEIAGVSLNTVYRHLRSGYLESHKLGPRRKRVPGKALRKYLGHDELEIDYSVSDAYDDSSGATRGLVPDSLPEDWSSSDRKRLEAKARSNTSDLGYED